MEYSLPGYPLSLLSYLLHIFLHMLPSNEDIQTTLSIPYPNLFFYSSYYFIPYYTTHLMCYITLSVFPTPSPRPAHLPAPSLACKFHKGRNFSLFCSLMYLKRLETVPGTWMALAKYLLQWKMEEYIMLDNLLSFLDLAGCASKEQVKAPQHVCKDLSAGSTSSACPFHQLRLLLVSLLILKMILLEVFSCFLLLTSKLFTLFSKSFLLSLSRSFLLRPFFTMWWPKP